MVKKSSLNSNEKAKQKPKIQKKRKKIWNWIDQFKMIQKQTKKQTQRKKKKNVFFFKLKVISFGTQMKSEMLQKTVKSGKKLLSDST